MANDLRFIRTFVAQATPIAVEAQGRTLLVSLCSEIEELRSVLADLLIALEAGALPKTEALQQARQMLPSPTKLHTYERGV